MTIQRLPAWIDGGDNKDRLLRWAALFVREATDQLEQSHLNPKTGKADDADVRDEIRMGRKFVALATKALNGRGPT